MKTSSVTGPRLATPSASGAPRADLRTRLAAIDGFDLATGLRSVSEHLPTLSRVLEGFVTIFRAGQPALLEAEAHKRETVMRWCATCHSLRGACEAIGAQSLLKEVVALERQLHTSAPPAVLASGAARLNDSLIDFTSRLAKELAS